jgi:protoporphyrinogen oxidase
VEALESDLLDGAPRVALAGAALRGLGVPACIRQGRDASHRVLAQLDARS